MNIQELLDKVFDGKETMSKADVQSAIESSGAKLADLTEGKYISVDKHAAELRDKETSIRTDYESKLASKDAELKRFEGIDPDAARKAPAEMAELKKQGAIRESLLVHRVRDIASAMPHIAADKVVFNDETKSFDGLNEQIDALVKDKPFLFDNGQPAGQKSSGTKSGSGGSDADVVDENAMRKAMGLADKK